MVKDDELKRFKDWERSKGAAIAIAQRKGNDYRVVVVDPATDEALAVLGGDLDEYARFARRFSEDGPGVVIEVPSTVADIWWPEPPKPGPNPRMPPKVKALAAVASLLLER